MNQFVPVSVVIPCFNCEKTIVRSIESVVNQSVLPSEVILVDDSSEDNTLNLIDSFFRNYDLNFKIIGHNINMGAAAARNTGLDAASFPFIAFLDSDDTWVKNKLELQYEFMSRNSDVALSGHAIQPWNPSLNMTVSHLDGYKRVSFKELMFHNYFNTPTVMMRKTSLRFPSSQRYAEDIALWLELAANNEYLVYLNANLAYVHKPLFGASGLSSALMKMELSELGNFYKIYSSKNIGFFIFLIATCYSILKFFRRLILTKFPKF